MTNPGFAFMPFMTTVIAAIGLGVALYLLFNDDRNEQQYNNHSRSSQPRSTTWSNKSEKKGGRYRSNGSMSRVINDPDQQCSICFDVKENEEIHITPCAHYFHLKCLQKWQQTGSSTEGRNKCPNCRGQIDIIN